MMLLLLLATSAAFSAAQQCETVISICDYNETSYENQTFTAVVHSVAQAFEYLNSFNSFIEGGEDCSSDDTLFLCAALFPECRMGLAPCQSLCEKVRDGCLAILTSRLQGFTQFNQAGLPELDELLRCDRLVGEGTRIRGRMLADPCSKQTNRDAKISQAALSPTSLFFRVAVLTCRGF